MEVIKGVAVDLVVELRRLKPLADRPRDTVGVGPELRPFGLRQLKRLADVPFRDQAEVPWQRCGRWGGDPQSRQFTDHVERAPVPADRTGCRLRT